jgi:hypothetical protein
VVLREGCQIPAQKEKIIGGKGFDHQNGRFLCIKKFHMMRELILGIFFLP